VEGPAGANLFFFVFPVFFFFSPVLFYCFFLFVLCFFPLIPCRGTHQHKNRAKAEFEFLRPQGQRRRTPPRTPLSANPPGNLGKAKKKPGPPTPVRMVFKKKNKGFLFKKFSKKKKKKKIFKEKKKTLAPFPLKPKVPRWCFFFLFFSSPLSFPF